MIVLAFCLELFSAKQPGGGSQASTMESLPVMEMLFTLVMVMAAQLCISQEIIELYTQ